jgi:hypothetical protein
MWREFHSVHQPAEDIFTASAQPWDHIDPSIPKVPPLVPLRRPAMHSGIRAEETVYACAASLCESPHQAAYCSLG